MMAPRRADEVKLEGGAISAPRYGRFESEEAEEEADEEEEDETKFP